MWLAMAKIELYYFTCEKSEIWKSNGLKQNVWFRIYMHDNRLL